MTDKLSGVFSAAATPLGPNLEPDHAELAAHCRRLLAEGCHGIALLGSTGEANSFSAAERMALLEAVVAGGVPPEKLMPGTGVAAIPETVALTKHALGLGVTTVVMLPPFYYKNVSDRGLIDAYSWVLDSIADGRLRVVLYHIPPIAQIPITFPVIEALLARYPQTIVGIKDSSGDFEHMTRLVETFPQLSVFSGADPFMLPLLRKGGAGCITATSNVVAAELRTVFDHWSDESSAGKVAAAQEHIVEMRTASNRFTQIPTIKAMVARRTGRSDWRRVRPPFVALTDQEAAELESVFQS